MHRIAADRCIVRKAVYTVRKCSWRCLSPETCRDDLKRSMNGIYCILLVAYVVVLMIHGLTNIKFRKFKFRSILTRIAGTSHEGVWTVMIISPWTFLRTWNVSDQSCRDHQNTHFIFSDFSLTVVPFMWCGKKYGRAGQAMDDNIKRRMRFAYLITKANVHHNNNNIYLLQLGCYPVAVVILHVNKHEIGYYYI